jgi:hypothetical protein
MTAEIINNNGGGMEGFLIDRWLEGKYPVALWRHGREDGQNYIITNDDDVHYTQYRIINYDRIMETTRNDILEGHNLGQWYITKEYIVDITKRGPATKALPEFSDEELNTLSCTKECEHQWEEGYCNRCGQYNEDATGCEEGDHEWNDEYTLCVICGYE